ncbi:MAG: hypothetical protein M0D55_01045 [Elusimicrobiota bacterium]|nr:MAG: hypothetical protein M0D55_01045 [Elusimicrobiota bacterium]
MATVYPSARTGTAQDLMRVVTKAYENRLAADGTVLPRKTEAQRRLLEPVTRLGGMMIALVMELVPADWTVAFHNKLFLGLAGGAPTRSTPRPRPCAPRARWRRGSSARPGPRRPCSPRSRTRPSWGTSRT